MGLSSSKSTTKPYYTQQVEGTFDALKAAHDANQANVQAAANGFTNLGNNLIGQFHAGDPGVKAATQYNTDVLSGRYLDAHNPYTGAMIAQANDQIANDVNAHLGTRGRTGGDSQASSLAREIGKNTLNLLYSDYSAERSRMGAAAEQAPALASAQYLPLTPALSALQTGTTLPEQSADQYADAVRGLLGQYTVTKQTVPIGQLLAQIAGTGLSAWAGGGFKGLGGGGTSG